MKVALRAELVWSQKHQEFACGHYLAIKAASASRASSATKDLSSIPRLATSEAMVRLRDTAAPAWRHGLLDRLSEILAPAYLDTRNEDCGGELS